MYTAIIATMGY